MLAVVAAGCCAGARADDAPAAASNAAPAASAAPRQAGTGPLVERARSMQQVWNGVAVSADGRTFVVLPRLANPVGVSLAQLAADGSLIPYPDAAWNSLETRDGRVQPTTSGSQPPDPRAGPGAAFIGLNAVRLAPDGALWVVDAGSPGFGKPAIDGGARLVRIDLATNQVSRVLTLPAVVLRPRSMIDDIRFNGDHAYITDAGAAGLIVLDLKTGGFRRVLDHDPALTAQRPIVVDGDTLKGPDGKPVMIQADQLEVSPDGRTLFVQPLCGPMSRIATALLDDAQALPKTLSAAIGFWYDTPALGGTAIGRDGTLYLNDLETDSILSLSPDRRLSLVIHDPRLHWADAPFLSSDGTLTVPVPQLDRAAPFHHGHSQIQFPVSLYVLKLAGAAGGAPAAAPAAK